MKDEFCKSHRQYEKFCPYLHDRPSEPWTEFTITNIKNKFKLTRKHGRKGENDNRKEKSGRNTQTKRNNDNV